jgi:uncharacterized protein YkwD
MAKRTTVAMLAIVAFLTAWSGTAQACVGAGRTPNAQTVEIARQAITCLINQRRHHHHLPRLSADGALTTAAQEHSNVMAAQNFFAHAGSDGTPASRASWAGYAKGARSWGIGENLGFGTGRLGSPKSVVNAWMRSSGHRSVVLSKRWRQIGVGVALGSPLGPDGADMATYTVDFGYRHG